MGEHGMGVKIIGEDGIRTKALLLIKDSKDYSKDYSDLIAALAAVRSMVPPLYMYLNFFA
jgi:hypothetical protein